RGDGGARDAAQDAADGRAAETADDRADRGAHADGGGHAAPGGLLTLVLGLPRRLVLEGQGHGGVGGVLAVELRGEGRGAAVDLGGDREDAIAAAEVQCGAREAVAAAVGDPQHAVVGDDGAGVGGDDGGGLGGGGREVDRFGGCGGGADGA